MRKISFLLWTDELHLTYESLHLCLPRLFNLSSNLNVPEEILAAVKVSSSQKLESEPERNFGSSSVLNTMVILYLLGPEFCLFFFLG